MEKQPFTALILDNIAVQTETPAATKYYQDSILMLLDIASKSQIPLLYRRDFAVQLGAAGRRLRERHNFNEKTVVDRMLKTANQLLAGE